MTVDLADHSSTGTALLHEVLERSGLSQAELARRAGIPRSVLNAYLRGTREPGAEAFLRLACAAGFDVELSERSAPVDAGPARSSFRCSSWPMYCPSGRGPRSSFRH
jgi:transcriptional regulator with XRE-family HTH domain